MKQMDGPFDVLVVGAEMAGLTASLYLSQYGYRTLLVEQNDQVGGLVNAFDYEGFLFDGGIRSIENSGVLKPLIRDMGLNVDFKKIDVSMGIGKDVITLKTAHDLGRYETLLCSHFPQNTKEIRRIVLRMKRILGMMNVLYGIDNPMLMDWKTNKRYLFNVLLPWFFKFIPTLIQIERFNLPVETYLKRFTQNQALIDMIAQHFFKNTPTFFALGYFSLYLDYHYPSQGTGRLPISMKEKIESLGGNILLKTRIVRWDLESKTLYDSHNQSYRYRKLIWASDIHHMYQSIDMELITSNRLRSIIQKKKDVLHQSISAESVLTVYLTVDLPPDYFKAIATGHFFYTPKPQGLNHIELPLVDSMDDVKDHLRRFYALNTYEISIPTLKGDQLAPPNQTGLIISVLMDYPFVKHVLDCGYYEAFKSFTITSFIDALSNSIYPKLKTHVIEAFCSTPVTFEKRTGNKDGAIFGFSFLNKTMPSEHKMSRITQSIKTPLPDTYQAGQWSFSPAGVPISVITGKLAADRIHQQLKKRRKEENHNA